MNFYHQDRKFSRLISIPLQVMILGLCFTTGKTQSQTLQLNDNLINFNSAQGEQFLIESQSRQDYLPLSIQFVTQINRAYCGVASMVMVLNSLDIPAPEAPEFGTNRFTQENFFNSQTEEIRTAGTISRRGMTLEQLAALLEVYDVQSEAYHGGNLTLGEFRSLIVENLREKNNFVLVNYLRNAIGQERGGHISPIAAYHEQSDRFLILDVSRYKYPPVWVKAEELWQATTTMDSDSGKTRGLVLVDGL